METTQKQITAHCSARKRHSWMLGLKLDEVSTAITRFFRSLWRLVLHRAGAEQKKLSIRGTAALGEHRFVSVIQFEQQRFLVGCSATSVTLLAQLPDEPVGDRDAANCEDRGEGK